METTGLEPKGTFRTHQILQLARTGLVKAGDTQIFTPMHWIGQSRRHANI